MNELRTPRSEAGMPDVLLSVVLECEHHEIDCGVATFIEKLDGGCVDADPLCAALEALRRHIYLEETFLFPPIREAGLIMPIAVMMREHGQLWHTMDALVGLLGDAANREPLREPCHRLLGPLEQHNSKEEPIIYPHADSDLPPQVRAELTRFIEVGRIPDGWVCQQAAG
jgi:iron-sulfur cluster repair protein YtfE (RIC family)